MLFNEAALESEVTHPAEAYAGIGLTSNCSGGGARLVLCSVILFGCEEMAHRKARLVRRCLLACPHQVVGLVPAVIVLTLVMDCASLLLQIEI